MPKCIFTVLFFAILFISSCKKEQNTTTESPLSKGNWQLQWIDIKDQNFVDEQGRTLQIRGINVRVDGLFDVEHADGRIANEVVPKIRFSDIEGIASMGFNVLRLPINWSGYEPERNQVNQQYIDRIKEVVGWCKQVGIYVQIDWHYDAYSKEIGEDGAPYWAVLPTIFPRVQGILDFNQLFLLRANPFCFQAYNSFFTNKNGIRDEFLDAWTDIINQFKDDNTVIGFEPMNEPIAYAAGISDANFMKFYEDCSNRMRAIDSKHSLWLEPDAIRNFLNSSPLPSQPFKDKKVVYCPHYYPNLTQGANYTNVADWKRIMETPMNRITQEANAWYAPVCMNEWGINPTTAAGKSYVIAMREMAEDRYIHNAFWLWKEPIPGTSGSDGNWGFYNHVSGNDNWTERTAEKKEFAVPYVMAVPGAIVKHRFNLQTNILTCEFARNLSIANPIIYIPENWFPTGFAVFVNGNKVNYEKDNFNRVGIEWNPKIKGDVIIEVKPN